ncbi:MAG TPA: hypothetical protein VNV86_19985 [Candidatus Acidoferrum sp.]|jgi:hypothetical protein|nr:hypothetical protein [Candidatus Acidoferrum sp.]
MGQELECRLRLGRRVLQGKAYLETDHLLFRGEERVKILLKDVKGVVASAGTLKLDYEGGPASFELGAAAEKWADKILHPPTRAAKLGIRPGMAVRLSGEFPADFLAELEALEQCPPRTKADLVFLLAPARKALAQIDKLSAGLKPAGALWVVYPKGAPEIREVEVIEAGRTAGLKDVKVASFSPTHTALKFVIPASAR